MKIGTFINHGTVIEIESVQTMNLSVEKGEVCIGGKPMEEFVRTESLDATTSCTQILSDAQDDTESSVLRAELSCPFTEAQQKASGIKMQAGVVLALMQEMQPLFTQKVDWLSPYSALLRRRWVDDNLSAWCRTVGALFGVQLDHRTLSADLRNLGSTDYTQWTDADRRIQRRKQLATDFDTRLTEYFERKRAEVMRGIAE